MPAAAGWTTNGASDAGVFAAAASARNEPFTSKPETAEYRVVYGPTVAVRDRPWGKVTGQKQLGECVQTTHRSIGGKNANWVRLSDKNQPHNSFLPAHMPKPEQWMLIDGTPIGLGKLLDKVGRSTVGRVMRYRVVNRDADIRDRPSLSGVTVVGKRALGRVLRTDQELNGWVRLQEDFYHTGKAEPVEGWALLDGHPIGVRGTMLETWEPASLPGAVIGGLGATGGKTERYWVMAKEGTAVRERPWGRVLCTKRRGMLLRTDGVRDGWARLEQDFTEEGPLDAEAADEEAPVLEGWVLVDGRDLGLPRQLQLRKNEKTPPEEEPRKDAAELVVRRDVKESGHLQASPPADFSLQAVLSEAKVSEDVQAALGKAGIRHFEGLIACVSAGDHHDELKKCGIAKLGARAKLATLVQPYWKALTTKEQGNALYKASKFEDAANMYTKAINLCPCGSTDLALNCYSNRAACFQQMREFHLALTDVKHVLAYDPANAKALARKTVYEQAIKSEQ